MNPLDKYELTKLIRELVLESGFLACGISPCEPLTDHSSRLDEWLGKKYHAGMNWMERHRDKRTDPTLLVKDARSVISVLYNYYPPGELPSENNYTISKYAYGEDYHHVIRKKLQGIINQLEKTRGAFKARAFTDSAPVFDRAWAARAGLGWIGKNTCLIHPKFGSFFFIGEIICDLELIHDSSQIKDLCGGCHKCIDACPTNALVEGKLLDSNKCISYHTIENRGEIPENLRDRFENMIFGCDICQDVCPWNRISKPHNEPAFLPSTDLKRMNKARWESLTEEEFTKIFQNSAIQRTRFEGLKRNIRFINP